MTKSKDKPGRKNKGQVKELRKEVEEMVGQRTMELSVLKDIASAVINRSLTLDQTLKAITGAVLETIPSAQRVVIHLCSEAANILVPIASAQRGRSKKWTPPTEIIQTIVRRAAKKRRRIHLPDAPQESVSLLAALLLTRRSVVGRRAATPG